MSLYDDLTEVLTPYANRIKQVNTSLAELGTGLTDTQKHALLACFEHVAWIDSSGQDCYNALQTALYDVAIISISAVFDSGDNIIYTDDELDSLKQYLTVRALYETGVSGVITSYTLSGTLIDGESTITISYNGKSTTVRVTAVDFYNVQMRSLSSGTLNKIARSADPNQNDTSMYPSRTYVMETDYEIRRNFNVLKGKAPYYYRNGNAEASPYYPIPVPLNANHVKISMSPGQFIYVHFIPYDPVNNYYLNTTNANKITWTQLTNGFIEKDLVREDDKQLFMILNSKYDSAGTTYPVEPTEMKIEFSEV